VSAETAAGVALIVVPVAFNAAFLELGRAFGYPGILREPTDVILRRFEAGGPALVLRWQALLVSALLMLPLVALLSVALDPGPGLAAVTVVVGAAAAIVQVLGLVRWPFAVPDLARRYVAAEGPSADDARRSIVLAFETLHRLFGVGVGEHLGYLLTGVWTILVGVSIVGGSVVAGWVGWLGFPIGLALLIGSLEFVGPNEKEGWRVAGAIVPIAYITWSIWLVIIGVSLLF